MNPELEAWKIAYAGLKDRPFPPATEDETLGDLHARLAEYDGYLAGIFERIAESGKKYAEPVDSGADLQHDFELTGDDARAMREYFMALQKGLYSAERAGLITLRSNAAD